MEKPSKDDLDDIACVAEAAVFFLACSVSLVREVWMSDGCTNSDMPAIATTAKKIAVATAAILEPISE